MSIRVTTVPTSTSRPRCVVSHVDQPSYFLTTTLRSYKQIAADFLSQACGLWVLHDVHLVDHHVCLTMATLRKLWPLGRTHLVLIAPSLDAPRQWAKYISGGAPSEGPERRLPPLMDVWHMPSMDAVFLANWLHPQSLEGDVLVFAGSNCQRDQLALALRVASLEPVYVVTSRLPSRIRRAPRILVGGPSLDGLLSSSDAADGVQHVVDFGMCSQIRADTGNDWQPVPITTAMALGRRSLVGKRGHGVYLAAYKDDHWLSTSPFATHLLRKDLCQAKLRTRFHVDVLHDFPIDLGPFPPKQVAAIMTLLDAERPVADMILGSASLEAGIGLAAVVAREAGPFPKNAYEKLQQGLGSKHLMDTLHRWAVGLGTTRQRVLKAVVDTPWPQAARVVALAYSHTTAVHAGARRLFVDVASGELLRCQYSHTDMPAVVYTHRYRKDIVSYVPLASIHVDLRHAVVLFHGDDADARPVEAWFEQRSVVATVRRSAGELRLVCGQQVDLDAIVAQWTAMQALKKRQTPLPVPVGPSMHIIFSAGLQVTDVVHDDDLALVECNDLDAERMYERPACRVRGNNHTFLLPSRDRVREICQTMPLATGVKARSMRRYVPKVRAELVIRVYLGRSTGRVTIRGPCQAWRDRIQASWGWLVVHCRIHHVPTSLDEFDVAARLGIDPFRVTVERSTNIVTELKSVKDLLHRLSVYVTIHRTLRINDTVVRLEANTADRVLRMVMDELPPRNDAVDQPLRCFWIVGVQMPSSPSSYAAASEAAWTSAAAEDPTLMAHGVVDLTHKRDDTPCLCDAIHLAETQLMAAVPDVLWSPALARTLPLTPGNVQRDGSRFLVHGSPDQREAAKRCLRILERRVTTVSDETLACKICFDAPACFSLCLCGCRVCTACLSTTFEMKCRDASFLGLLECPFCHTPAAATDILATVSERGLLAHALKMAGYLCKKNPRLIQACPAGCGFFGRLGSGGSSSNDNNQTLACPVCVQWWCIGCTEASGELQKAHKGFCVDKRDMAFWKTFAEEATAAGAKECPSCKTLVVKDEGCNHVTCVAPSCNTHFCWKCGLAFSHIQSSALARGIIRKIGDDDDKVVVAVDPETWNPPCMTPCPSTVTCKKEFVSNMLVPGQSFQVHAIVYVYVYIYDHIDSCAS